MAHATSEVHPHVPGFVAPEWLRKLVATADSTALAVARLTLGIVIFPHGAQKVLGWFGGHGFSGTMGYFTQGLNIPAPVAFLVIVAEFFGSLALIAGVFTRVAAIGIAAVMLGAVFMVHIPHGFFMDWGGTMKGEGFEYHLLAIGLALALIIGGAGRASVDRYLTTRSHS